MPNAILEHCANPNLPTRNALYQLCYFSGNATQTYLPRTSPADATLSDKRTDSVNENVGIWFKRVCASGR